MLLTAHLVPPVDPGSPADTYAWTMLFVYLALALGVSFLCSLLEASLLTIGRPYIEVLIQEGRRSGERLKRMKENVDRPLAAILTLNTVAHTVGAAGVGAQVLVIFGSGWVAAASIIVTLLILVFSEIIPKTLGAVHAKRLAGFTAATVNLLIWLTYPLVWALEALSRLLGGSEAAVITRSEVAVVADLGESAGALEQAESRVIRNLLRLEDVKIEDVMTPRSVAVMLPRNMTVQDAVADDRAAPFSRLPVYDDTPDNIVGIVLRRDLHAALRENRGDATVGELAKPLHAVPELASVEDTLNQFIERQEHIFLVVDEFGGTAGIITLEDAVETLLGVEIVDESDSVEDMRALARRKVAQRRELRIEQRAALTESERARPQSDSDSDDNGEREAGTDTEPDISAPAERDSDRGPDTHRA